MFDRLGQIFKKWSKGQIKIAPIGSEYIILIYMECLFGGLLNFYFGKIYESINYSDVGQQM